MHTLLVEVSPQTPKIPQGFLLAAARFSKTLFALRAAFSMNFSIKSFPVPRRFSFQFFTTTGTFPFTKAFAETRSRPENYRTKNRGLGTSPQQAKASGGSPDALLVRV